MNLDGISEPPWNDLVRHLRAVWNEPDIQLVMSPEPIRGGWSRRIWRVELACAGRSRTIQARFADPGRLPLAREHAVQEWLFGRGFPVPEPVLMVDDHSVLGDSCLLLEWVHGSVMADLIQSDGWSPDVREGTLIGNLLASLHGLDTGTFPTDPPRPDHGALTDRVLMQFGDRRRNAVRQRFQESRLFDRKCICHLDLHPRNVIQTNTAPVVIDWEKTRLDHPLIDVAMAQVHVEMSIGLDEYPAPDGDRSAYSDALLAAYSERIPVSRESLSLFRVVAACIRLTDVMGALDRAELSTDATMELERERDLALAIVDAEMNA